MVIDQEIQDVKRGPDQEREMKNVEEPDQDHLEIDEKENNLMKKQ